MYAGTMTLGRHDGVLTLALTTGASKGDGRWVEPTCKPPSAQQLIARYPGLEEQFSYPIHTRSHDAQKLFDLVSVTRLPAPRLQTLAAHQ